MTTPAPMSNNKNNRPINLAGCNRCRQLGRWCVEMGHNPADPRCRQCRQANIQRCTSFRVKQSSMSTPGTMAPVAAPGTSNNRNTLRTKIRRMAKTNANEAAELRQKLARTTESLHVTQNQLNAKELEVQNADRNAALRLQEMVRLRIKNNTTGQDQQTISGQMGFPQFAPPSASNPTNVVASFNPTAPLSGTGPWTSQAPFNPYAGFNSQYNGMNMNMNMQMPQMQQPPQWPQMSNQQQTFASMPGFPGQPPSWGGSQSLGGQPNGQQGGVQNPFGNP
ncbi:hypothetical protein KC333_g7049 [Hortaea werneckii]|nr:hypothetical protein KC333_g7049 [Hortaea werneckii]KAI7309586.1 hypothetical protein KC326_g6992 [Hortaea werneckii]